jgi:hypothetical protein
MASIRQRSEYVVVETVEQSAARLPSGKGGEKDDFPFLSFFFLIV